MGCKHQWQLTHSNDTYPYWCVKCGKRSTGLKTPHKRNNKGIAIGIILGISMTIAGFYFYDNYKGTISNLSGNFYTSLNENSNGTISKLIQASNNSTQQVVQKLQTLAQQEEAITNSAQLNARQQAALVGQEQQQRQAAEQAQLKAAQQNYDQQLGAGSSPPSTVSSNQGTDQQTIQTPIEQTSSQIDSQWVNNFIAQVNVHRTHPLGESSQLDALAQQRFQTMVTHYQISHYGASNLNIGEVVFYPDGYTPQDYANDIQTTAPLHWQLLTDPSLYVYGYYISTGPTVEIIGGCSTTEIPGPNIDEVQFFQEHGCQTTTGNATWLVIDLNYG